MAHHLQACPDLDPDLTDAAAPVVRPIAVTPQVQETWGSAFARELNASRSLQEKEAGGSHSLRVGR